MATMRLSLLMAVLLCSLVGCGLSIDTEGFLCNSDESCRIGAASAAYICDKSELVDGRGVCARPQSDSSTLLLNLVKTIDRWADGTARGAGICVGDVDSDGKTEVLSLLSLGTHQGTGMVRIYDDTLAFDGNLEFPMPARSCVVADPDKDGANELVVATTIDTDNTGHLYVGSFKAGVWTEEWKSPDPLSILWGTELAVADLDRDGANELVVAISSPGRRVELWEWDGSTYQEPKTLNTYGTDADSVAIGDVDGDGRDELVVGLSCWTGLGVQVYDETNFTFYQGEMGMSRVALGDVDGDARSEILVGTGDDCRMVYQPYEVTVSKEVKTRKKVVRLFEHEGGKTYVEKAISPDISQEDFSIVVVDTGDLTGDKAAEVVGCAGYVTVTCKAFSYSGGQFHQDWSWASKASESIEQVRVVDIDDDGSPEVLVATSRNLYVFRLTRPD
jgi:hypothetical protein